MDWYLERGTAEAVSDLRQEIVDHVLRHAAPDADVAGAEIAVSELLTNAARHGASVVLEERIALGDPECRVAVWLRGEHAGQWRSAHDYRSV